LFPRTKFADWFSRGAHIVVDLPIKPDSRLLKKTKISDQITKLAATMNSSKQTAESIAQAPTMSIEELMQYASDRGVKVFTVMNVNCCRISMNSYKSFRFSFAGESFIQGRRRTKEYNDLLSSPANSS
jgi:flavoprotein